MTCRIPPKIEGRDDSRVVIMLHEFSNDEGFKNLAAQRMHDQLFWISDSKKITKKSRNIEVHFWSFNESFAEIPEMRLEGEFNETCVENREPAIGGGVPSE
jgi:hypothetical protein